MKIAGIERCSFVDWPGMLAAVLFTPGCNMNCYYCHNRHLLEPSPSSLLMDPKTIIDWLQSRQGMLDGVVITGGEPTIQPQLMVLIDQIRAMGYPVKLDTNGARPDVLDALLSSGKLHYVAMDIKAPESRYEEICGHYVDQEALNRSIDLIRRLAPDYEFRTTVLPQFSMEDITAIAERIKGAKRYILQQYRSVSQRGIHSPDLRLARDPHAFFAVQEMARSVSGYVQICETRGLVSAELAANSGRG